MSNLHRQPFQPSRLFVARVSSQSLLFDLAKSRKFVRAASVPYPVKTCGFSGNKSQRLVFGGSVTFFKNRGSTRACSSCSRS